VRILVTGANGLLGQKLCTRLAADPATELIATARRPLSVRPVRGYFAPLDTTNETAVRQAISRYRPDVVINTAAMTNVDQCETERAACWLANVEAVQYLADACNAAASRLLHLSTDFIFDGAHGPLDETATPAPVNYYGESKLAAEQAVQQISRSWAILRTVLVYGVTPDMSRSNIVLWVKNNLEAGKKISVVNDQWRTPTLAEDLALGCHLAAVQGASGIYHISGEEMMTPCDIAIETARYFNLDESLITATDSTRFTQPARRPLKTGFVIEKARRELGYAPHTFRQGLEVVAGQLRPSSGEPGVRGRG
jgi:dTDP-4-dehydrorhamnose reductase